MNPTCPCGCGGPMVPAHVQLVADTTAYAKAMRQAVSVTASNFTWTAGPIAAGSEFSGREFAAGVVTGVRSFKVDKWGRLTGVTYPQVWTPGENTAVCKAPKRDESDPAFRAALAVWQEEAVKWERRWNPPQDPRDYFFSSGDVRSIPARSNSRRPAPPVRPEPPLKTDHAMPECSCGFYGYYDGSDDYRTDQTVSAVVEGWGEVIIGSRGFRVTKARIRALCFRTDDDPTDRFARPGRPDVTAERIGRLYAPVPVFTRFDDMVAAFPPDQSLEPPPDNDPDFWTRP